MEILFENTIYPIVAILGLWVIAELIRLQIVKRKLKNTYNENTGRS